MKHYLERGLALLILVILSPAVAVASAAIVLIDRMPPFYSGDRIGLGGKTFRQLKFRTMAAKPNVGPTVTVRSDPRVTRLGAFLRRSKLDEIPQLLNIVHGDMGFLGPRPEDPANLRFYSASDIAIFALRPGLVSPASLSYANEQELLDPTDWEASYRRIVTQKVAIDRDYFDRSDWWTHSCFILRVARSMLSGWSRPSRE